MQTSSASNDHRIHRQTANLFKYTDLDPNFSEKKKPSYINQQSQIKNLYQSQPSQTIKANFSLNQESQDDEFELKDQNRARNSDLAKKVYKDQEIKINVQPDGNVFLQQTQRNQKNFQNIQDEIEGLRIENQELQLKNAALEKQNAQIKEQSDQLLKLYLQLKEEEKVQKEFIQQRNKENAEIKQQYELDKKKLMDLQEELTSNFEDHVKVKWQQRLAASEQKASAAQDQKLKKELENQKLQKELYESRIIIKELSEKLKLQELNSSLIETEQLKGSSVKLVRNPQSKIEIQDKQQILANHQSFQVEREYWKEQMEKERKKLQKQIQDKNKIIDDQSKQIKDMSVIQEAEHKKLMKLKEELKQKTELLQQIKQHYEYPELKKEGEELKLLNREMLDKLNKAFLAIDEIQSSQSIEMEKSQIQSSNQQSQLQIQKVVVKQSSQSQMRMQASSAKHLEQGKVNSVNSFGSYLSHHDNRQKIIGDFHKATMKTVGLYSTLLDYQSLNTQSKQAALVLKNAEIDLQQNIAKKKNSVEAWIDNN